MAQLVRKSTRPALAKPGPKSAYPWDEWLDGQARILTRGEDYNSQDAGFSGWARKQAALRKMRVKIDKLADGSGLLLQAFTLKPSTPPIEIREPVHVKGDPVKHEATRKRRVAKQKAEASNA